MKILVIKRDKIGDLLLTTPMLAHLKAQRPEVQLHLLANDYNAWVVAGNGSIDRLWVYARVRHAGRAFISAAASRIWQNHLLRAERFDWAIVANGHESPRAIDRGFASGAKRVVAYCANPARYPKLSDPMPLPDRMHECDRLIALLAPVGIAPPSLQAYPSYELPREQQSFSERWLAERGVMPKGYAVIGLGARRPKKQPAPDQVLGWARRLQSEFGLQTVFIWTPGASADPLYPGDDDLAQPVLDAHAPFIHPFRGPILPAIGLIWNARISIIPDSGLMHFAAASPGGVLGLFAETDVSPHPSQWGPRGRRADYLEARKSVADLDDAEVFSRVRQLLENR